MKKYAIGVVSTLLVLFILAQTGLLAPFGIKQISFMRENEGGKEVDTVNEEYVDSAVNASYKFKVEGKSFYVYYFTIGINF